MSNQYKLYVVESKTKKIRLFITADCPIAHSRKGQCSSCDQFAGLNPKLEHEGLCNVARLYKPIDDFRSPIKCSDKNRNGDCTTCPNFLGFSDNAGFFCSHIKKEKK